MKANKLTPKEREMLRRAAELILAGEWPWEYHDARTRTVERKVLENAVEKLTPVTSTTRSQK